MKVFNVEQGSDAWAELRRGIPTASEFHRIVTPGGKLSKQARGYAYLLVAEELLGRSLIVLDELEWVAHGKATEPEAARWYEAERDLDTTPVGLIKTDDERMGASPDRLVSFSGILEIKCPAPQTHVAYMVEGFACAYKPQVQGQLLISEREWADWVSYSPELPAALERVYRDEPYIDLLRSALDEFCDMKDALLEQVRSRGVYSEPKLPKPDRAAGPSLDEQIRLNELAMRMHAP
jgi:hypothetical protein